MTKAIVVYDTKFGNTEKIAKVLAEGMKEQGVAVDCFKIGEVEISKLNGYDFLVVGGPTQGLGISKPMKDFLKELESAGIRDKKAFAFDTKLKSRFAGSAGKGIENRLRKLQMSIVKPHASAIVKGTKGPLEEGTEEKFKEIASEIAKLIQ
jgi:flavorubredoxin